MSVFLFKLLIMKSFGLFQMSLINTTSPLFCQKCQTETLNHKASVYRKSGKNVHSETFCKLQGNYFPAGTQVRVNAKTS